MISKFQFIREWDQADASERKDLSDSLKVSNDWDREKTDPGCAFFLGSLAEFIVRGFLEKHNHLHNWPSDNEHILTKGDDHVPLRGKPDFRLYSNRKNEFVPAEVKYTSRACVDTFNLASIPDYVIAKARKEGAEWILLVDCLRVVSQDPGSFSYGEFVMGGPRVQMHIIAHNTETNQTAILADPTEVRSIIKGILGGKSKKNQNIC